jgi:hypothetical protein
MPGGVGTGRFHQELTAVTTTMPIISSLVELFIGYHFLSGFCFEGIICSMLEFSAEAHFAFCKLNSRVPSFVCHLFAMQGYAKLMRYLSSLAVMKGGMELLKSLRHPIAMACDNFSHVVFPNRKHRRGEVSLSLSPQSSFDVCSASLENEGCCAAFGRNARKRFRPERNDARIPRIASTTSISTRLKPLQKAFFASGVDVMTARRPFAAMGN